MKGTGFGKGTAWLLMAILASAAPGFAGMKHGGAKESQERDAVVAKSVDVTLLDLALQDQDGKTVRFRSDVIGDKLVVVDVFFTSCGLVCPILGAIYADLQDRLGDRLGGEVRLVSISVDPKTDVPRRLKEFASRWEAKPGWILLTGEKHKVDQVLEGIGAYTADFTEHPTMILVGDGSQGGWTRFYGFATPDQVIGRLDELSAERRRNGR